MTYLRCTIGRWNIDLHSEGGREVFRLIEDEGLRVFREQPGFIRYRLMVADPSNDHRGRRVGVRGAWRAGGAAIQGVAREQRHSTEVIARNLRW